MKQFPSRLKYKKNHKPSMSLLYLEETKNFNPIKGSIVLKSLENGRLNYNQIEACRKSIRRVLKKKGIIIIRILTNISLTKKPIASRMGSGKGSHSYWVGYIKKGQIICEFLNYNLNFSKIKKAVKEASYKLPVRSIVSYNYY